MRAFINAILSFIGATNLTDEEFATITITAQTLTAALYLEIKSVLSSRDGVTGLTKFRLKAYFIAKGISGITSDSSPTTPDPSARPVSNIFIGDEL